MGAADLSVTCCKYCSSLFPLRAFIGNMWLYDDSSGSSIISILSKTGESWCIMHKKNPTSGFPPSPSYSCLCQQGGIISPPVRLKSNGNEEISGIQNIQWSYQVLSLAPFPGQVSAAFVGCFNAVECWMSVQLWYYQGDKSLQRQSDRQFPQQYVDLITQTDTQYENNTRHAIPLVVSKCSRLQFSMSHIYERWCRMYPVQYIAHCVTVWE